MATMDLQSFCRKRPSSSGFYALADGLSLVGGYQAQLWQDVTVEISDDDGDGLNIGKSDLLIHGLFLGLAARW